MDSRMKFSIFSLAIIFASLRLRVLAEEQYPPSFIRQPHDLGHAVILFQDPADREGSFQEKPIQIPCEAEGAPEPEYYWTKNNKPFNSTSEGNRISQEPGNGTITIHTPQAKDTGEYQCFTKNIWGIAASDSINLRQIKFDPSKEDAPQEKQAFEGESYNFACHAPKGYPTPDINWFKQDSSGKLIPINDSRISVDLRGTLWFSNITKQDASEDFIYTCVATQTSTNRTRIGTKVKLNVVSDNTSSEQNKIAPLKQFVSENVHTAVYKKATILYCIFGGTPLPTITWTKGGKPLQFQNDTYSLSNNGNSVEIKHVTLDSAGNYTCQASNGVGAPKSHTIYLNVLAEPRIITAPGKVTVAEGASVLLPCRAEGIPTPEIHWIYNGKDLQEAPLNPRRTRSADSLNFQKVLQNDTGNYGCIALNRLGYDYQQGYLNVLKINFN